MIMKWIIEVEETVKMRHQIIVDIDNEGQLEKALDNAGDYCTSLDDFVDAVADVIPVLEINEEYYAETDSVEYFDDYEDDVN
ncbi:MAG: hypothetical protein ACI4DK_13405 [Lachnospiraceae bacterium]